MADYNSSDTIIMKPAVSSLGGNSAQYTSNKVGGGSKVLKGGNKSVRGGSKVLKGGNKSVRGGGSSTKSVNVGGQSKYNGGKKTQKRRKSTKKCWWKVW